MRKTLQLRTREHATFQDITEQISQVVRDSSVKEGLCYVFVPHTTAGITINENADPNVVKDILAELDKRFPWKDGYAHYEGNSAAHIKASLLGFTETLLIQDNKLVLGTWQGIYLAEFDGPRQRRVHVKVVPDPR